MEMSLTQDFLIFRILEAVEARLAPQGGSEFKN